ncbi:reverse transcriptase domain-containing protein [Tanacetum coccineum]|uniref:Reverse transcriptase domain-containing protein n=1 Tax=Tanacetum coccineum TaxID=301880 RepID=A0ABQ5D4X7_9ASTR
MATSDLLNELYKEGFKLDVDLELRLSITVPQQLDDPASDVSRLAIKWVITILKTNTPYPSRKIRRIRAYTHQRPQRKLDQYAVSKAFDKEATYPELKSKKMKLNLPSIVKGNDLKTYNEQDSKNLATYIPTIVPDSEKMIEVFIGGLPRSIEGNVTASKPQTLEEAINIAQRLRISGKKVTHSQCNIQVITNESLRIEETPPTTTTTPMIATTITTPTITTTTTIKITTTITTVIMITTNSRIEGKKLSELMLPPQLRTKGILKTKGTMETFLCVQDAPCITQSIFALSSVILATKCVI